jgi:hypothetical protein
MLQVGPHQSAVKGHSHTHCHGLHEKSSPRLLLVGRSSDGPAVARIDLWCATSPDHLSGSTVGPTPGARLPRRQAS